MLAVQFVEPVLLGFVHGKLLESAPRLDVTQGLHRMNGVFCRGAASFKCATIVSEETVTVSKMRVGPSASAFGSRRQTTSCCWGKELWW